MFMWVKHLKTESLIFFYLNQKPINVDAASPSKMVAMIFFRHLKFLTQIYFYLHLNKHLKTESLIFFYLNQKPINGWGLSLENGCDDFLSTSKVSYTNLILFTFEQTFEDREPHLLLS